MGRESKTFRTTSGGDVERVYGPGDLPYFDPRRELGEPGQPPYTRGIHADMYRSRLWTMRQYAGFGDAAETNRRFHYLLEQGQTGLSVAFDLPTQMGYDSDHRMAAGEVGKVGVAIDTVEDMRTLLRGIPLEKVSTSMTINATAAVLLAMYLVVAEEQGVPWEKVSGTVQNDLLKEYIARGTYIYPVLPSLRITTDIFAFCRDRVPGWNTISISGYHIREAGSTAVQELAFTLANARVYVQAAVDRGLPVDEFGPRLSFFFNAHSNLLEEVAKFRAARRLWYRIMTGFGAKNPRSTQLRFHAQTAGSSLTAQQPATNVVRTAYEALAAVLGGAQSLHTNSMDEALSLPSEASALLALRTQQILAEETGVADTVDPLGGSYYVESLTRSLEAGAESLFEEIERRGGMVACIENGWVARQVHESAYRTQLEVEKGERVVVGVNRYRIEGEPPPTLFTVDPKLEAAQKERLARARAGRDAARVARSLASLESAARGDDNLLPHILEAVRAEAGVGEISDRLRGVFGTFDHTRG